MKREISPELISSWNMLLQSELRCGRQRKRGLLLLPINSVEILTTFNLYLRVLLAMLLCSSFPTIRQASSYPVRLVLMAKQYCSQQIQPALQ